MSSQKIEHSHKLEGEHYGCLEAVSYAAIGWRDMYTDVKEFALINEDVPRKQSCHPEQTQDPIGQARPAPGSASKRKIGLWEGRDMPAMKRDLQ